MALGAAADGGGVIGRGAGGDDVDALGVGAGRAIGADGAGFAAAGVIGLAGADGAVDVAAGRGFLAARLGAALLALRAVFCFLAALRAVAFLPRVAFPRTADFAVLRVAVARLAAFFVTFFFAFFAFFALRAIAITSSCFR
ncbi:MAG TPA: hypothetical protein VEK55_11545 [Xanthobacteraceae bacterium]|nr:hypothetical protein [Xanthobacteraceae bacterium]